MRNNNGIGAQTPQSLAAQGTQNSSSTRGGDSSTTT